MRKKLSVVAFSVMCMLGAKEQIQARGNGGSGKNGIASFYHDKFEGRPTATGEVFHNDKFTAASNQLKLNTYVKVTNLTNGKVVYVRINDRMNKSNTRLIDLASIAAKRLNFQQQGLADVKVEVVPANEGKTGILAQRAAMRLQQPANNRL